MRLYFTKPNIYIALQEQWFQLSDSASEDDIGSVIEID